MLLRELLAINTHYGSEERELGHTILQSPEQADEKMVHLARRLLTSFAFPYLEREMEGGIIEVCRDDGWHRSVVVVAKGILRTANLPFPLLAFAAFIQRQ